MAPRLVRTSKRSGGTPHPKANRHPLRTSAPPVCRSPAFPARRRRRLSPARQPCLLPPLAEGRQGLTFLPRPECLRVARGRSVGQPPLGAPARSPGCYSNRLGMPPSRPPLPPFRNVCFADSFIVCRAVVLPSASSLFPKTKGAAQRRD